MKTYSIFGITDDDLHASKDLLEAALDTKLTLHDSDFLGGGYYRAQCIRAGVVTLQTNFNSIDQEWTLPDHKNYKLIVYVTNTDGDSEARRVSSLLDGIATLISSEEI